MKSILPTHPHNIIGKPRILNIKADIKEILKVTQLSEEILERQAVKKVYVYKDGFWLSYHANGQYHCCVSNDDICTYDLHLAEVFLAVGYVNH